MTWRICGVQGCCSTVQPLVLSQADLRGCCCEACQQAPRLLRAPKALGYYGSWQAAAGTDSDDGEADGGRSHAPRSPDNSVWRVLGWPPAACSTWQLR